MIVNPRTAGLALTCSPALSLKLPFPVDFLREKGKEREENEKREYLNIK